MDIQSFIDGMSAAFKHERSKTQMTLGDMIDQEALRVLEQMMRREAENAEIALAIETGQMPIIESDAA
jgi:hypothetical protein